MTAPAIASGASGTPVCQTPVASPATAIPAARAKRGNGREASSRSTDYGG